MTIPEAIQKAVMAHDVPMISKIVNQLRFGRRGGRIKLDYKQQAALFLTYGGCSLSEFEGLMQEVDDHDSVGNEGGRKSWTKGEPSDGDEGGQYGDLR